MNSFYRYYKSLKESYDNKSIHDYSEVYTIEELLGVYSKLEVSTIKMDKIQTFLQRNGYSSRGVKCLVPDIKAENEIESKAKEIIENTKNFDFWRVHMQLHAWVDASLSKDTVEKIRKEYDGRYTKVVTSSEVDLIALERFLYGLIIIPDLKVENKQKYVKDLIHKLLDIGVAPHYATMFRTVVRLYNISQFKVYKKYNVDKNTERAWGDLVDEL